MLEDCNNTPAWQEYRCASEAFNASDLESAEEHALRARDLCDGEGDSAPWQGVLMLLSITLAWKREMAQAIQFAQELIEREKCRENMRGLSGAHGNLGMILGLEGGDAAAAPLHFREAVRLARAHGSEVELASALSALGNHLSKSGEEEEATRCLREAAQLAEKSESMDSQVIHALNFANHLKRIGKHERAERLFAWAQGVAMEGKIDPGLARTLLGQG